MLAILLAMALVLGAVPAAFAGPLGLPEIGVDAASRGQITTKHENADVVQDLAGSPVSQEEREAAAARMKLQKAAASMKRGFSAQASLEPSQGGIPDYFGDAIWAFSPPLRKFVDELPGVGSGNKSSTLDTFISVAHPDTITYPGSDYYEIELQQYAQQMHSDLPPTTLRGYVQVNQGTDVDGNNTIDPDPIMYLGPAIVARKGRPVRIKFTNKLGTGDDGKLFLPVDTTVMGAGMGPLGEDVPPGDQVNYTENRGTLHLHGGHTPWISDGTAHQWITPQDENTPYPKGVSVKNVPDMPDPGDGSQTFYYTNDQSARMMFYHDHSFGITRLNVYAGEAAGYFIGDDADDALVESGVVPTDTIPLIVQDKTFVDTETVLTTDPTWNWGTGTPNGEGIRPPVQGDLWYPHVYSPAQNPADLSGMNAYGRWHFGPWFWPPTKNIQFPPIPNPYYDQVNAPWENATMPAAPNPSAPGEAFMDTPIVNGAAFPTVEVDPKAVRLRILNASDDRFWNLQMYEADATTESVDHRTDTEVKMVPAEATAGFPETWPTDGRDGGVPDPATAGPDWIQIGTESGFLPKPAIVPQQPVVWNADPTTFNMGNVSDHSLLLGPAERADVVVDFSDYRGKTLLIYNDAPAAFPARDARLDYYTNAPDLSDTGGYGVDGKGPQVGFGPNTRTVMQIKVKDVAPADPYDVDALNAAFASTDTTEGVFESSQNPIIVPEARHNEAYNSTFTADPFVRIFQNEITFETLNGESLTIPLAPKAIQDEMGETYDPLYGRMASKLGLELPNTTAQNQNFVLQNFIDPPTEMVDVEMEALAPVAGDSTQLWKITHNGVDTHPIHFHLFDVQLINRVGWDNGVRPPDDNEIGWKETVRISPLEDTIVALRPTKPKAPFGMPESVRPLDPTMPLGSSGQFTNFDPTTGEQIVPPTVNALYNFGWEYTWHCHILSHEEMDMMRPVKANVSSSIPTSGPVLSGQWGGSVDLTWTDPTPKAAPSTMGNPDNEIGFRVERATLSASGVGPYSVIANALANATSYTDDSANPTGSYKYRVVAFNAAGDKASNVLALNNPLLDISADATEVDYDGGTTIRGKLKDVSGVGIAGKTVVLQRSINSGATWSHVATNTSQSNGNLTRAVTNITTKTRYRWVFAGDATNTAKTSASQIVTPRVVLSTPIAPDSVKRGAEFTAYGYLRPKHYPSGSVKIYTYRFENGNWVYKGQINTTLYWNDSTRDKWQAKFSLPSTGSWRLRAYMAADAEHAATFSGNKSLTVTN
ncbi:MAG: multicopper oxidase domain-containing protein [Coriobacteriales bacterium]|nr:multicopper oxidase domain-containing protein [Coriobacteriales bacterium]